MLNNLKHAVVIVLTVVSSVSCTRVANSGDNAVASTDSELTPSETMACQTFGFRNWNLLRDDNTITVSGEAMLPTPAWSVVLHRDVTVDDGSVQLVMETIEPSGLSNSVISWVSFETSVDVSDDASAETSTDQTESAQSDVLVKCSGELIWSSRD